jgi:peptidoglycan/xylan/chitin deacetylase (PgdA/CDA1 family)
MRTTQSSEFRTQRSRRCFLFLSSAFCVLSCAAAALAYEPGHFYHTGHTKEKVIALTFDDGPGATTPAILDLLKQHQIHATFFMLGTSAEAYPAICRQVVEAGHEIGNHTYMHFDYHLVKNSAPQRLVHELEQTEASLQRAAGIHTHIVRMPYGYFNHTWLLPTLKEHGYALVHWSFGTDWILKKPEDQMIHEYIANAKPGAVFLFHDGGRHREKTLAVVTAVIEALEKKGYKFISADEMFNEYEPKAKEPTLHARPSGLPAAKPEQEPIHSSPTTPAP